LAYIVIFARLRPQSAPAIPEAEIKAFKGADFMKKLLSAFFLPILLIIAVLGSIFLGIASPTEAAAVGAMGATLLTIGQRRFSMSILKTVMRETSHLTTMVFIILLGATCFSFVFRELGGDVYLVEVIQDANLSAGWFLLLVMAIVFVAGFFIDFIEIIFIIVPVVSPIFHTLGLDLVWVGILLALNLQTSFLTPPFGFSLFYLKGVAPPNITTGHLYRGIIPFVVIQLFFLLLVALFPEIIYVFKGFMN
ncbi:MAG TPA: TRAP transporter large permease subunit, partial [Flavilitoribacter sp.]|nr:TRAP transporter large permease subunit [Flavilitoribacter sp.]